MRSDMKKVLCERPRAHSKYCYHDVRQRENHGDLDELPHHQGIRRPYGWDQKELTDHIRPLIRFMWSSIGKPFDEVWADVCRSITPSFMGDHVLDHARDEIDINCFRVGDEVWTNGGGRRFSNSVRPVSGLYVDPIDGIIRTTTPNRRTGYYSESKVDYVWHRGYHYVKHEDGVLRPTKGRYRPNDNRVPIKPLDDDTDALLLGGIWYKVTYAQVPPARLVKYTEDGETKFRRVNEQRQDAVNLNMILSGDWYYATKRQMTSHELRRHGLKND